MPPHGVHPDLAAKARPSARTKTLNQHAKALASGNPFLHQAASENLAQMKLSPAEHQHVQRQVQRHQENPLANYAPTRYPLANNRRLPRSQSHLLSDIGHAAVHAADVTYHASPLPSAIDAIAHPGNEKLQRKDIASQAKNFSKAAEVATGYKEIKHVRQNPLAGGIAIASLLPPFRAGRIIEEAALTARAAREASATEKSFRASRQAIKEKIFAKPPGPRRTPEEAAKHVAEVSAEARSRGAGVKGSEIPVLGPNEVTPETGGALGREVRHALEGKQLKEARKAQEAGYSAERSQRIAAASAAYEKAGGGLAGHIAAKSELKGALPKVATEGLSHLDQPSVDALIRHINDFPGLQRFGKISATDALLKLANGETVAPAEKKLLQKVFGREVTPASLRGSIKQMGFKNFVFNLINIPRTFETVLDLSYALRQGFVALLSRPKLMIGHLGTMVKAFGSEQVALGAQKAIEESKTFPLMEESGLNLTSFAEGPASREEPYMYSQVAEHLPLGVGKAIRASDRSYVIAGNLERASYFDFMAQKAAEEGWDLRDPHLAQSISKFANTATGRGALPKVLQKHALTLNATFFSPRLMASRFNLLSPAYYITLHPFVRREALRSLMRVSSMVSASLYMAHLAGAKVEMDPRNANFGKAQFGKTKIDFTGGYGQIIRLGAQLGTGTVISSTSGKVEHLTGGPGALSYGDIIWRFFSNKFNPIASTGVQLAQQRDTIGQPLNFGSPNPSKNFILSKFTPMLAQDIIDMAQQNPKALPAILPDIFGAGVQTYGPRKKKSSGGGASTGNPYGGSTGSGGDIYGGSSSSGGSPYGG